MYVTGKLDAPDHGPTNRHWEALKVGIRYLLETPHAGLVCPADQKWRRSLQLMSRFTDSNFAGDVTDRKYTSGADITYNGTAFSWESRKNLWFPCLRQKPNMWRWSPRDAWSKPLNSWTHNIASSTTRLQSFKPTTELHVTCSEKSMAQSDASS